MDHYNMSYNLCALLLTSIILVLYLRKYKNVTLSKQNKTYKKLLLLHLTTIVLGILMYLLYSYAIPGNALRIVLNVCAALFYTSHCLIPYLFAYYSTSLTSVTFSKKTSVLLRLPLLVPFILILLSPWKGYIFYIDTNCLYHGGSLLAVFYAISISYLCYSCIYAHHYRNILRLSQRISLYSFVIFSLLPIAIQNFVPHLALGKYSISLCLLLMYLKIERPEESLDSHTDTFNLKSFTHACKLRLKTQTAFETIFITLDYKVLNYPKLGNRYTQRILKMFASYLQQLSPYISIYRVADRTFALILPQKHKISVTSFLLEIKERLTKPFRYGVTDIFLNGIICYMHCPEDTKHMSHILSCIELLEDKRTTYNNEIIYAKDLNLNYAERRTQIELALQRALQRNSFEVYYQPIFSTKEQKVVSAEALLRLNDPELGFIPPDEFIPIAEENGMIIEIGNFVLHSVCQFIKDNHIEQYGIRFIEINLSVIQCMQLNMAEHILQLTKQYELSPSQINLEITETAASDSPKMLQINMNTLVNSAVTFSLDDYGTGYSNVAYIMELPFHMIKLDKSMVWSSFENSRANIAFESTVAMIQKLGMHIVAEGVETYSQAAFLTSLGIEYLQGYYFAKPMPAKRFIKYLTEEQQTLPTPALSD